MDDSIDPEFTYIPPMLIQPFIENAILHGLAPKESHGSLVVTMNKNGEAHALQNRRQWYWTRESNGVEIKVGKV
ncbi:MAG: hypothetical protein R2764_04310 [Bacteroidales bacterium]